MANWEYDTRGAVAVSAATVVLLGAIFFATSDSTGQLSLDWARLVAVRLALAVLIWAWAIFRNRPKLGLRTCFELGALLLIALFAFGVGRILGDIRVEPTLTALGLGWLSTALFVGGASIGVAALNLAGRLISIADYSGASLTTLAAGGHAPPPARSVHTNL
jgi:hypothetical protein